MYRTFIGSYLFNLVALSIRLYSEKAFFFWVSNNEQVSQLLYIFFNCKIGNDIVLSLSVYQLPREKAGE